MNDVKNAVKEARKKGILVVSMVFGEENYRDIYIDKYKFMYEKNIISCNPADMTSQVVRLFKKIIIR